MLKPGLVTENIGPKFAKKCNDCKKPMLHGDRNLHSFALQPICNQQVLKTINKMQNNFSYIHDQISIKKIKLCGPVFSRFLLDIFNQIIGTRTSPSTWKISKTFPMRKSGSYDESEKYRPISLLCALSKTICHQIQHLIVERAWFSVETQLRKCNI